MHSQHRTAEEFDRDIAMDRSRYAHGGGHDDDGYSLDRMAGRFSRQFRAQTDDIARDLSATVRENPVPLALAGAGLACLIAAGLSRSSTSRPYVRASDHYGYGDNRQMADTAPHRVSQPGGASPGATDRIRDYARQGAQAAGDYWEQAKDRLALDTEELSQEARDRVVAARAHALALRDEAAQRARQTRDRAQGFYERQPLLAGVLAVAAGSAIAAALPRTRVEDDTLGRRSDEAFAYAERVYAEERAKLGRVAQAARDEAKDVAQEMRDSVPDADDIKDAAKSRARSVTDRVSGAAEDQAKAEGLGKPGD